MGTKCLKSRSSKVSLHARLNVGHNTGEDHCVRLQKVRFINTSLTRIGLRSEDLMRDVDCSCAAYLRWLDGR